MAKVTSRVKINQSVLKRLNAAAVEALEKTGEWLHTEVVQATVIPRMDGNLQGEATLSVGQKSVKEYENGDVAINILTKAIGGTTVRMITSSPQARRLYFHPEYHFQKGPWEETIKHRDGTVSHLTHEGNPNAKGKWLDDWNEEKGGKKVADVEKAYAQFYRRMADT